MTRPDGYAERDALSPSTLTVANPFHTPEVPNYRTPAIVVTLLVWNVFGVMAIYFASQARLRAQAGNYESALRAARIAKVLIWLAILCWVLSLGIVVSVLAFSESSLP